MQIVSEDINSKKFRMSKKIAILQSNYIPWKGYFDLIALVDEFIIYDDMQYTRRDWRNRNKIKTNHGLKWLTIPVEVKGKYTQKINETKVVDQKWRETHFKTIEMNYRKSQHFEECIDWLHNLYFKENYQTHLTEINLHFIKAINELLSIKTKISLSSDYHIVDGQSERLLSLCTQSNADEYISGPAAKGYLDTKKFEDENIKVNWMDYSGYNEYPQLHPPFEHGVSIIDLIFNTGVNASNYLKFVE